MGGHLKSFIMARGNQRDKAREANQKKMADMKKGNSMSGSEMQREKEKVAAKMKEKPLIRSRKVIRQYEDTYATLRRSSYGLTWICFGVLDQSSVEAWDAWLRCLDCVD